MSQAVIVTGSNGLIGSAFVSQLKERYQIQSMDVSHPTQPVNITNRTQVTTAIAQSDAPWVVHFAAFTDVTAAWEQTGDKSGAAYQVNVIGTQNIVDACNHFGKHLIHISTAYVFDGEKDTPYTEEDSPHPIEWYGTTKALAEEYIQTNGKNWTILRIDQPFRREVFTKLDLAHKIANQLAASSLAPQFNDHYFGPTWIPDLIQIIEYCMIKQTTGLYHASSGESWTNYNFALEIANKLGMTDRVQSSSLQEYLKTQQRPYQKNTALNCSKLFSVLDFSPISIKEAINRCQFNP